jgi:hypothetical protein
MTSLPIKMNTTMKEKGQGQTKTNKSKRATTKENKLND